MAGHRSQVSGHFRLTTRLFGAIVLTILAVARGARAQVDLPCPDEFTVVAPELFNPVFSGIFDVAIDWDLAEPGHAWNLDSLRAFADVIIDEHPDNNVDLITRLVSFFSEDLDESYEGLAVAGSTGIYDRFHICIREEPGDIHGAGNRVSLANIVTVAPGIDEVVSIRQLASESFAHEWQHVTYEAIAAGPKFNGRTGTNEFLSKAAEYFAGNEGMWPVHDNPYERAFLGGRDYYAECIHDDHADHKYSSFGLFAAYLLEHFAHDPATIEDDLLHRWLGSTIVDIFGQEVNQIAPESLADLLAEPLYDDLFTAASGPERLEELFHEFALSLWVNSPSLRGAATVWADGARPQERYQLFTSVNGIDCADDARSLPLAVVVGEAPVEVAGPIWPEDVHGDPAECREGFESREFPRYPKISTYGVTYLLAIAAPELKGDECTRLELELRLEDRYVCHASGVSVDALPSANQTLNISVLGYPQSHDSLDLRGDEAVELACRGYGLDTLPRTLRLTVPCFASTWQAVVFAMSVTETVPSHGYVYNRIFPFSYRLAAAPDPSPAIISADETWGAEEREVCIDRNLRIAAGARVTIEPGTAVRVAAPTAGIQVFGELVLEGSTASLVDIGPAVGDKASWRGLQVMPGGLLDLEGAVVTNGLRLETQAGSRVALRELVWDGGIYGGEIRLDGDMVKASHMLLTGCERVDLRAGRLDSVIVIAAPDCREPLMTVAGQARACSFLSLDGAGRGLRIDGGEVALGPGVKIRAAGEHADASLGLEIAEGARVAIDGLDVKGFAVGLELTDAATCTVRNSTIEDCLCGVLLTGTAGHGDFGTASLGSQGWGNNSIHAGFAGEMAVAVENRSPFSCMAQMNYWGSADPPSDLFAGDVAWTPFHANLRALGAPALSRGRDTSPQARVTLESAWPNPCNPRTNFTFLVKDRGRCLTLNLFDVTGRYVARPISGYFAPGRHTRGWDARDPAGRPIPSGVYFARFEGEEKALKVMLLR